jgi:hypothetical protein
MEVVGGSIPLAPTITHGFETKFVRNLSTYG